MSLPCHRQVAQELEEQEEEVATVEFRRNFFTEVHQHRGTSPPFPEQELLDCVSDGDGEPLDSLEERCKVVPENLWRFTFVLGRLWFLIQTRFQLGDQ